MSEKPETAGGSASDTKEEVVEKTEAQEVERGETVAPAQAKIVEKG